MSGTLHDVTPDPPRTAGPVPFVKAINISGLSTDEYEMLDVLPPGRSSIMLTHIRVVTFSRSGDGWIKPYFVADDNTETPMISEADINSTGEKAFNVLRTDVDLSTKKAIKNIRFKVYGTGTVTANLTCYGYVY